MASGAIQPGCAGGDGETLEQFEAHLETNLAALRNKVVQDSYEPRPLLSVVVESPGKKPRRLAVPAVGDRVLQTAVAIVLTPLFEAEFEDCSFAYRRGRSVDLAVRRIMQYRDQGFRWVVDADIASFFGRYYGVIDSLDTDPVLLQRDQFLWSAEPEFCLGLARPS